MEDKLGDINMLFSMKSKEFEVDVIEEKDITVQACYQWDFLSSTMALNYI